MTQSTQAPSLDWTEDAVAFGDTALRCRSAGAGAGDILLVVGADVSPALELLAADRRVVLAGPIDRSLPPREAGDRIGAIAGALGLDAVAVLASGPDAAAALWAAVDHPDLVRTLVLEAPTIFSDDAPADPQLLDAMVTCEVSTLVLLGQHDPAAGPRFAADYKRLPACSTAIVYAAGPDIREQRPGAFAVTVGDYLRRGQAYVLSTASTLIHA